MQDESCFTPINIQDSAWVEVTHISLHYSPECSQIEQTMLPSSRTSVFTETNCAGRFVYVGDIFSMSNSVHLTSYRPRFWAFGIGADVPNVVEKILSLTYHVSLTLALLNALPVSFWCNFPPIYYQCFSLIYMIIHGMHCIHALYWI